MNVEPDSPGATGEPNTSGTTATDARFRAGASRYADYLQTTEGRLRLDLAWLNLRAALEEFEGEVKGRALDVGGGTGALSVRLASEGWHVTLLDSSNEMLWLARQAATRASLPERITFQEADAASLAAHFAPHTFDLVICHNLLEYVADPRALMSAISAVVRTRGLVSLLARNRAGEVMRAAVKQHDLAQAGHALDAEHVTESLYGGAARLFDAASLRALADAASLDVVAVRGVRVVADYIPPTLTATDEDYARLSALEQRLGARPDFAAVARYTQLIARRRPDEERL